MSKAIIVYASRTGQTKKIGELIAEGIRLSGHEANVVKAGEIMASKSSTMLLSVIELT